MFDFLVKFTDLNIKNFVFFSGLLQVQDTLQLCGGPHKESEAVTEAPHRDLML